MTGEIPPLTRYSPAVLDASAKTPMRLAAAIALHASRLYEERPAPLGPSPNPATNLLEGAHLAILEAASLDADLIEPDTPLEGVPSLWVCPQIATSFDALSGMGRRDLMTIAGIIRHDQPQLRTATYVRADGRVSADLGSVIEGWAEEALAGLISGEGLGAHASMLTLARSVFSADFSHGVESIDEIDRRLEDACIMLGLDEPATIGTFLLRNTGLVDADTWRLGASEEEEGPAGMAYALVLSFLAHRAGLGHAGHTLQDAYEALALGRLHGIAGALANGGSRNCEEMRPNAPQFAAHRPATLRLVADALLGTHLTLGGFASVVAAAALQGGDSCQAIDLQLAHRRAEFRFMSQTPYDDAVVAEALCSHLDPFLPSPRAGLSSPRCSSHELADQIADRLSEVLRASRPQAPAIGASTRYLELVKRIGAAINRR